MIFLPSSITSEIRILKDLQYYYRVNSKFLAHIKTSCKTIFGVYDYLRNNWDVVTLKVIFFCIKHKPTNSYLFWKVRTFFCASVMFLCLSISYHCKFILLHSKIRSVFHLNEQILRLSFFYISLFFLHDFELWFRAELS